MLILRICIGYALHMTTQYATLLAHKLYPLVVIAYLINVLLRSFSNYKHLGTLSIGRHCYEKNVWKNF